MKKLITSIVLSTALIGGACMATGCTSSNSNSTGGDDVASVEQLNTANFYTYGAASIGSIISAEESTEAVPGTSEGEEGTTETPVEGEEGAADAAEGEEGEETLPDTAEGEEGTIEIPEEGEEAVPGTPAEEEGSAQTPEQSADGLTDEQLSTVNNYMGLVENLLANGGLSYVRTDSDREGYEVKEVISFSDLEGNVITYVMYYNSTLEYVETEFDHKKEETESVYVIEGIVIIDGVEYALEGRSEVETDGDETETETYFKVILADGSYIIMEQETEADETELVYKVVSDKKVVEKIKFEYETEEGETELKMTVEKDGVKTSLKFRQETEQGVSYIKVTAKGAESDISFKIEVTSDDEGNNIYQYTFGDKIKEMHRHSFEKGNWNDDKWGDVEWNYGEWNKKENDNGKWQWHVEEIIDRIPAELIPPAEGQPQEGAPVEGQIPEDVEEEITEQVKNYLNAYQNAQNKH